MSMSRTESPDQWADSDRHGQKGAGAEEGWIRVTECPACRSKECTLLAKLKETEYCHHTQRIPFPREGVSLLCCDRCGLVYKSSILSRTSLSSVCSKLEGQVWSAGYGFEEEVTLIQTLAGKGEFDLLDIGAAGGWLLKAVGHLPGRRSALDMTKEAGLDAYLQGEFIMGCLDGETLDWSGEPYDVVTMFDVAEHLYDADKAFSRLRDLTKNGGVVVLETGDTKGFWPAHFGVERWWYVHRFPHNIFWSVGSLTKIARRYGFNVVSVHRKRNKDVQRLSLRGQTAAVIKSFIYGLSPALYRRLLGRVGTGVMHPRNVIGKDHMRVVLKVNKSGMASA